MRGRSLRRETALARSGDEVNRRLLAHLLARFEGRNGAEPVAEVATSALPSASSVRSIGNLEASSRSAAGVVAS
jgi:hypothetical protein